MTKLGIIGAMRIEVETLVEKMENVTMAAHGAKVQHLIHPIRLIAQEGGRQMLHGVNLGGVHHRLVVGLGQPQVKGGNGLRPNLILPGHIQSRLQLDMINGKTCDFFHRKTSL